MSIGGCGGIGRRAGLRIRCPGRAGSSPVTRTKKQDSAGIFESAVLLCNILAENSNVKISHGALAQLGAHHTGSVGVRGSSPLCSTKRKRPNYAVCGVRAVFDF